MAYNNNQNQQKKDGYDKTKDMTIWGPKGVKGNKRYLNVTVYNYDNHGDKIRVSVRAENTNPNQTDPNKKWINLPGISGMTKDEAKGLAEALLEAITQF